MNKVFLSIFLVGLMFISPVSALSFGEAFDKTIITPLTNLFSNTRMTGESVSDITGFATTTIEGTCAATAVRPTNIPSDATCVEVDCSYSDFNLENCMKTYKNFNYCFSISKQQKQGKKYSCSYELACLVNADCPVGQFCKVDNTCEVKPLIKDCTSSLGTAAYSQCSNAYDGKIDTVFARGAYNVVNVKFNLYNPENIDKIRIYPSSWFKNVNLYFNNEATPHLINNGNELLSDQWNDIPVNRDGITSFMISWNAGGGLTGLHEIEIIKKTAGAPAQAPTAQPQVGVMPFCLSEDGKKIPVGGRIKKVISSAQTITAPEIGGATGAAIFATKAGTTYDYLYCEYDFSTGTAKLSKAKAVGELCDNNYECYSNYCRYGTVCGDVISEAPKATTTTITTAECLGCTDGNKCLPVGFRRANKYCPETGATSLTDQSLADASCVNNYECKSNLCSDGKCRDITKYENSLDLIKNIWCKVNPTATECS